MPQITGEHRDNNTNGMRYFARKISNAYSWEKIVDQKHTNRPCLQYGEHINDAEIKDRIAQRLATCFKDKYFC